MLLTYANVTYSLVFWAHAPCALRAKRHGLQCLQLRSVAPVSTQPTSWPTFPTGLPSGVHHACWGGKRVLKCSTPNVGNSP